MSPRRQENGLRIPRSLTAWWNMSKCKRAFDTWQLKIYGDAEVSDGTEQRGRPSCCSAVVKIITTVGSVVCNARNRVIYRIERSSRETFWKINYAVRLRDVFPIRKKKLLLSINSFTWWAYGVKKFKAMSDRAETCSWQFARRIIARWIKLALNVI